MEFFKKHYEKLVLAVLLLLFILSMIYLLLIIRNTSGITARDLDIPTRAAEFRPIGPDDPLFDIKALTAIGREWNSIVPRDPRYQDFSSNLVVTFPIARCAHCSRLIPLAFFNSKPCPFCGLELPPPEIQYVDAAEKIPQEVKDALGQPNLPELGDLDGDGFSNLYEFKQRTELNNPLSRPPLWHRLVLMKIEKVKLDYRLMKVSIAGNPDDKSKWDFQINRTDTGKTEFVMLNDIIKIDGVDYRIADVKLDQRERKVGNDTITEDRSVIFLEMLGGDRKLEMQVNSDVFSSEPKAFLLDTGDNQIHVRDVGGEFRLGNRFTGVERYRVKSIDQTENKVYLVHRTRGVNYNKDVADPITREGKIPVNQRVNLLQQMDGGMMGPRM